MADEKQEVIADDKALVPAEEPKDIEPEEPPVDHLASIRELALQLPNISPSGAETISQKIIAHLDGYSAKDREEVNG